LQQLLKLFFGGQQKHATHPTIFCNNCLNLVGSKNTLPTLQYFATIAWAAKTRYPPYNILQQLLKLGGQQKHATHPTIFCNNCLNLVGSKNTLPTLQTDFHDFTLKFRYAKLEREIMFLRAKTFAWN